MPGDMGTKINAEANKLMANFKARIANDVQFVKESWTTGLLPAAKNWTDKSRQLNRELAPAFLKMK